MILHLPFPPSVNNLFLNIAGKGRVPSPAYKRWREAATNRLWLQRPKRIEGPVEVKIVVEDRGSGDLDNKSKVLCDFAVIHGIIEDDGREIVRKITLEWGDVKGCSMEIIPYGKNGKS